MTSYDVLDQAVAKHAKRMQECYEERTAGDSTWHGFILLFLMDIGMASDITDEVADEIAVKMEEAYENRNSAGDVTWYGFLFMLLYKMGALPLAE